MTTLISRPISASALSTSTRSTKRTRAMPQTTCKQVGESAELNRLLCAAVVSKKFCAQLLRSPELAIESGYNGESFNLTPAEREFVITRRANSLTEFAEQIVSASR